MKQNYNGLRQMQTKKKICFIIFDDGYKKELQLFENRNNTNVSGARMEFFCSL